jgi:hypothetical protein
MKFFSESPNGTHRVRDTLKAQVLPIRLEIVNPCALCVVLGGGPVGTRAEPTDHVAIQVHLMQFNY